MNVYEISFGLEQGGQTRKVKTRFVWASFYIFWLIRETRWFIDNLTNILFSLFFEFGLNFMVFTKKKVTTFR